MAKNHFVWVIIVLQWIGNGYSSPLGPSDPKVVAAVSHHAATTDGWSRTLNDFETQDPVLNTTPSNQTLAAENGTDGRPPLQFSFVFPLFSVVIMWAIHKNKHMCCNDDTVVDDSIPSEIILDSSGTERARIEKSPPKPDIELQSVVGNHRSRNSLRNEAVKGTSMLNQTSWSDETSQQKDSSFSWMEESSNYRYMND